MLTILSGVRYTRSMHERQSYYLNIEGKLLDCESMHYMMTMLDRVFNLQWSSGYGGKAYSKTVRMGIEAINALEDYWADDSRDNLMALIDKANALEHAVHNNGFFFNKFMDKKAIDWGTDPNKIQESLTCSSRYGSCYGCLRATHW